MNEQGRHAANRAYRRALDEGYYSNTLESHTAFSCGWNALIEYRQAEAQRNLAGEVARTGATGCLVIGILALLYCWALWANDVLVAQRGIVAATVAALLILTAAWLFGVAKGSRAAAIKRFNQEWGEQP